MIRSAWGIDHLFVRQWFPTSIWGSTCREDPQQLRNSTQCRVVFETFFLLVGLIKQLCKCFSFCCQPECFFGWVFFGLHLGGELSLWVPRLRLMCKEWIPNSFPTPRRTKIAPPTKLPIIPIPQKGNSSHSSNQEFLTAIWQLVGSRKACEWIISCNMWDKVLGKDCNQILYRPGTHMFPLISRSPLVHSLEFIAINRSPSHVLEKTGKILIKNLCYICRYICALHFCASYPKI